MAKVRLRFAKNMYASFISHLDLTRLFSRALSRAKIKVEYSKGFNPHPLLVFTPPLSLGYESRCELLDFNTVCESINYADLKEKIAAALPVSIELIDCYEPRSSFKDIAFAKFCIIIENDQKIAESDLLKIQKLFESPEVIVFKKSKRGGSLVNIIDKMRDFSIKRLSDTQGEINVFLSAAPEDSINPEYLIKAIGQELFLEFDFVLYKKISFYYKDLKTFL